MTDSKTGELAVLDVRRGRVVGRVALGGAPRHLSYEPSAEVVWVVLGNAADRIAVVDVSSPTRPRLLRRFSPPLLAHDVGFGPGRVWVTGGASGELVVYGPRGRPVRLRADAPPQHVTFVGNRAYVASGDDGTLRVHDARTGRLLRTSRASGRLVQRAAGSAGRRAGGDAFALHAGRCAWSTRAVASSGSRGSPAPPTTHASSSGPELDSRR